MVILDLYLMYAMKAVKAMRAPTWAIQIVSISVFYLSSIGLKCKYICVYAYVYIQIYKYTCINRGVYIHMCMQNTYMHIWIYVCKMHTNIHGHTRDTITGVHAVSVVKD